MTPRRLFDAAQTELGSLPYQSPNQIVIPQKISITSAVFGPAVSALVDIAPTSFTSTSIANVTVDASAFIALTQFTTGRIRSVTVTSVALIQPIVVSGGTLVRAPEVNASYNISAQNIESAALIKTVQVNSTVDISASFLAATSDISFITVELQGGGGGNRNTCLALLGVG